MLATPEEVVRLGDDAASVCDGDQASSRDGDGVVLFGSTHDDGAAGDGGGFHVAIVERQQTLTASVRRRDSARPGDGTRRDDGVRDGDVRRVGACGGIDGMGAEVQRADID